MKKTLPSKLPVPLIIVLGVLLAPGCIHAQGWKLVGITGQRDDGETDAGGAYVHPDHTLFEINTTTGASTKLFQVTFVNDSQSIGYCPVDGLLYHTAGSESYSNDPGRNGHDQGGPNIPGVGYQDSQYMETVNLATHAMSAIFNAAPCPNPDPLLPCFGLPALRPTWVRPEIQRDSTQTGAGFRERGENEYHAARGMAWSSADNLFYLSDETGIYKMTRNGNSTFLARPTFPTAGGDSNAKGIAAVTELLVGHQEKGFLMRLDAATGEALGDLALIYPPGGGDPADDFGGLLGIAQHPVTGVLYGIRKTANQLERELVTINPVTGETTLVGSMGQHVASITFAPSGVPAAPWRLIGITGQRDDGETDAGGAYVHPDHTLFEINTTTGASTKLFQVTFVNDSQSIGYCPVDGLLYHTAGSESYSNDPGRNGHDQGGPNIPGVGYQDSQYMETVNLATHAMSAIFNAAPCPNPDPLLPCFGLPALRPTWVRPEIQRDSTQTGAGFRERGENEYHAARGMAWSSADNLFYLSDETGIYKMTRNGNSTFLARPTFPTAGGDSNAKGIAAVTTILVGHQEKGALMRVDAATGEALGDLALIYPPGGGDPADDFGGLLGIAQHPVTGVLYGIRKTANQLERELVTINSVTGETALVGSMGQHVASVTFVPTPPAPPLLIQSVSRAGTDITITWTGGTPPYQLQTSTTLTTGGWTNLGAPTSTLSATVPMNGPLRYYRVAGQ